MGWRPHFSTEAPFRSMKRPSMTRRDDSLIGQVVAANVVLVALTLLAASLAAGFDLSIEDQRASFLILALAIMLTLCVNLWMLQRRFAPLERLITRIEGIDPAEPASHQLPDHDPVEEIDKLSRSFNRLLERIEEERRRSGTLAMRAQEEERRRLARDLHDEVNQALTAILLRLEALAQDSPVARVEEVNELKRLVNQAMDELLNLARQLRPSALDDHGLMPAIETQLKRFSARTGVEVSLDAEGDPDTLPEDVQTAVYRVLQEALANVSRHAGASAVAVEIEAEDERLELRVRDDGAGFDPVAVTRAGSDGPGAGLGLSGMAERARLAGGELDVRSAPGGGTTVTMRIAQLQRVAS
jgi:two-component system, NarL family, sensor histidine kinase UhpB